MKILIASNLYPPQFIGGAEIVARRQARRLAQRGHHVSILAGWLPGFPGETGPMQYLDGLRVYRFPFRHWEQDRDFRSAIIETFLDAIIAEERPDILHAHNLRGLGANLIPAAKRHGLPVIVTLHDYWWHCLWGTRLRPDGSVCTAPHTCGLSCSPGIPSLPGGKRLLPVRLRRDTLLRSLDQTARLVAPSLALAEAYKEAGIPPKQITVISNGLDLEAFSNLPPRPLPRSSIPLRFTAIASLSEHKGIPDLLEAATLLQSDRDLSGRWQLTIAGDGHLRGKVEAEIATGRFGNAVRYVGQLPRPEALALLNESDVVVLASRWPENEPLVLLEGAAAGAAQLATDLGGARELVQKGRSGELVPPGDPLALAAAMAAYIRAPEIAALHGTWNAERRSLFDESLTIRKLEDLYTEVLAETTARQKPPLVLCGGVPGHTTTNLIHHLHHVEPTALRPRLVWHGWAESQDWMEADFFWDWGGDPEGRERALLTGLPVLAPEEGGASRGVITYRSVLEVAAALTTWLANPGLLTSLQRPLRERLHDFWRDAGPAPGAAIAKAKAAKLSLELTTQAEALELRHPDIVPMLQTASSH